MSEQRSTASGVEERVSPEGRRVRVGALSLHVESRGCGRPVVILHGFTGSAESMAGIATALADRWRTHAIDLVGHGRSDAPDEASAYSMQNCVEQVLQLLDALAIENPHLLGYSMGGRVALSLCTAHPGRFASALLVGASPGLAGAAERAERAAADASLADRILDEGLEAFVDYWMALPLFAGQRRLDAPSWQGARRQRLCNRPHALAASLRGMGTGAMPSLHEALATADLPVCLVTGERDAKFAALAAEMAKRLPRGRTRRVPDAGHAAHLENRQGFTRIAREFFGEVDAANECETEVVAAPNPPSPRDHPAQAGPDTRSS